MSAIPTLSYGRICLRRLLGVLLLVALWMSPLRAQSPAPAAATPTMAPLSLSEIMERSENAGLRLQTIEQQLSAQADLGPIQAELSRLTARVEATASETSRRLDANPPLSVLLDLEIPWRQLRPELTSIRERLTKMGKQLDVLAADITQLTDDSAQVRTALAAAHAPPEVIDRDNLMQQATTAQRQELLARQRQLLTLRERATESLARTDDAMADIDSFGRSRVQQIFVRETVPLWRQGVLRNQGAVRAQVWQTLRDFAQPLPPYLRSNGWKLGAQLLIVLFTALLLRHGRATAIAWPQRDAPLEQFVAVTEYPWSAALLVSLLTMVPIERDAPRILWVIAGALAIPAVLRVVRRIIDPQRYFLASVLATYVAFALFRSVWSASPPLLQACVTIETLMACGLAGWVVFRRADRFSPRITRLVRTFGRLGVALLAANFIGALCGYLDLAQLVVFAALGSVCVAAVLTIGVRVALGLAAYLLRVRPLSDLRLIRRNRDRVLRFITRVLTVLVVVLWGLIVLRELRLFDGFLSVLHTILDTPLRRGAISLSLEDIVEFGITIWLTWLLSIFIRFVLEEDIYPRVTLPRGVPYALSTLLHYSILILGFFVALGVVGVDLTKATILAGALGVGVGFGLQNIVNNFVSGLILLFERPVQVGDTVVIRDVAGEIQHIGIRSCVVRTWDGAEVILPNAILISDPVTNWTLSTRLRRITLTIGVAYGNDPAMVTELLRGVAAAHPGVLQSPEPQALFMGFGDSALNLQLRAWTDCHDAWVVVQSDLYLAVHKALADAGIQIPFPQHDLHINNTTPLPVRVVDDSDGKG